MSKERRQHHPILVIEDLDSDFELVVRRLRIHDVPAPVERCADLDGSMRFLLNRKNENDENPLPALCILDLRLPDGDGVEVLERIKRDDQLKKIPVAVWTASSDPDLEGMCVQMGADVFLRKSADATSTDLAILKMVKCWRNSTVSVGEN